MIAVVDDDQDVRLALDGLLGSIGFDALLYENADELLASDDLTRVDCIISDLQMPGTNGLQLARKVQPLHIPLFLITAYPTQELERQAAAAGVRDVLIKPFDPGRLIAGLDELLGR